MAKKKRGFEDFDWESLNQFLEDWDESEKVREQFINELITELAVYFISKDEQYLKTEEEFVLNCKKEARWIAEDFAFTLSDLLYHYETKEGNFLEMDDLTYFKYSDDYDASHLEELATFPHMTRERVDEAKRESIEEHFARKKYAEDFHNLVKKFVVEYVPDLDKFPARALRELDLICYLKMDDFEQSFHEIAQPDREPSQFEIHLRELEEKMKNEQAEKEKLVVDKENLDKNI
jgi:hypothetical protein